MKRTIIFIDGQNLHFALADIGLQEKDINWEVLFKYILPPDHELIRAYWYQPARVAPFDFFPAELKRNCPEDMDEEEYLHDREVWLREQENRLRHIQDSVYRRLQQENDFIEFCYAGILKINPYFERFEERGVDVAIGVDMVSKVQGFDAAILVSGDVDLLPAINYIKDKLKFVYQLVIKRGDYHNSNYGYSRGLMVAADKVLTVFESEVKDHENNLIRY
ncbi:MAG: NYN domain-containing protein [Candidatus Zixiibacteriota bacterium]